MLSILKRATDTVVSSSGFVNSDNGGVQTVKSNMKKKKIALVLLVKCCSFDSLTSEKNKIRSFLKSYNIKNNKWITQLEFEAYKTMIKNFLVLFRELIEQ